MTEMTAAKIGLSMKKCENRMLTLAHSCCVEFPEAAY
jgi:hypothetical protein